MNLLIKRLVLLLALTSTSVVLGLESDRDQQISISADQAEFSELDGATKYEGNVRLTQGTISLSADRLMVYSKDGEITRILAIGDPANYEQLPEIDGELITARGLTIDYQLAEDVIYLVEDANLEQGGTALSGNTIVYDVRENTLRASGRSGSESDRVEVVIPPSEPADQPPKGD